MIYITYSIIIINARVQFPLSESHADYLAHSEICHYRSLCRERWSSGEVGSGFELEGGLIEYLVEYAAKLAGRMKK